MSVVYAPNLRLRSLPSLQTSDIQTSFAWIPAWYVFDTRTCSYFQLEKYLERMAQEEWDYRDGGHLSASVESRHKLSRAFLAWSFRNIKLNSVQGQVKNAEFSVAESHDALVARAGVSPKGGPWTELKLLHGQGYQPTPVGSRNSH